MLNSAFYLLRKTPLLSQRFRNDVLKVTAFNYSDKSSSQAPEDENTKQTVPIPSKVTIKVKKKECFCAEVAVEDIHDGAKVLIGGVGLCGIPENMIRTLAKADVKDLTVVACDVEVEKHGVGLLIKKNKVKRLVTSHLGNCDEVCEKYCKGELETEFVPQGTLAEKIRAGGAGIPAFYTAVGNGTLYSEGNIPIKYDKDGKIVISNQKHEVELINGKEYIREEAITADFALLKAWKGDLAGNLVFRKAARNFNPTMAKAAKRTIAEVEELVQIGDIKPDEVHLPGIYVDRIFQGEKYEKRIQKITVRKQMTDNESVLRTSPVAEKLEKILRRVAKEFKDGMFVNLGVGLPLQLTHFIPRNINVYLQSENGILGLGPYPSPDNVDPDLINSAKETVTVVPGASFFSSEDSFGMIRAGHVDLTVVGAHEVSQFGDLANWTKSNKAEKGMGAQMDVVCVPDTKVIAIMEHVKKDGSPRILENCSLPLTASKCVSKIITDLCVFDVDVEEGLILTELAEDARMEDILVSTGCSFKLADDVKCMASN